MSDFATGVFHALPLSVSERVRAILARRPFLKNVSIMLSGAAAGQMISILLSPLLTRLYSPQQFGILSVYSALLAILTVIASLRYELALPLARSDEDAINLTAVCGLALLATTAAIGIGAVLTPVSLIEDLWRGPVDLAHIGLYRALLVLGYFCLGGYFIALYVATRVDAYGPIAQTRLAQGVVGPVSQILLALVGAGGPGLLFGSILGQSAGTGGLFYKMLASRRALLASLSWRRMAAQARRYIRFPLVGGPAALLDSVGSSQLLYLLITTHYSAGIAGFVFLAERIVSRPLSIVGTSILQVFIGEAGRNVASDPRQLERRFHQVVSRQFGLAALWVLAANLGSVLLFPTVFGKEWGAGVVYLQAMSIAYLAQAAILPVFHTLQIMERQTLSAVWEVSRLVVTVAVFFAAVAAGLSPAQVILCYSAAQALSCLALYLVMARAIRHLCEVMS